MITFDKFNNLSIKKASELLFNCCGSSRWVSFVMERFPFSNHSGMLQSMEKAWYDKCTYTDWQEAFLHHPKIGDLETLTKKFSTSLAGQEQKGVDNSSMDVLKKLAKGNSTYEDKFGFIFIVFATGKSALEMLNLLKSRLDNSLEDELRIAMGEQYKITQNRLKQYIDGFNFEQSQVTTHVLNTAEGTPGEGISIVMKSLNNEKWVCVSQGITNADGRISELLPPNRKLPDGIYKMIIDTQSYFKKKKLESFYPSVEIQFYIINDSHYHIPLLISPFGYTTYRGS
ncbi:MAG: 2-oxo-4-hydroxy-4-carboxy-5-ureidoimidazoline decarboxylase [Ferruginibacter sp.]